MKNVARVPAKTWETGVEFNRDGRRLITISSSDAQAHENDEVIGAYCPPGHVWWLNRDDLGVARMEKWLDMLNERRTPWTWVKIVGPAKK